RWRAERLPGPTGGWMERERVCGAAAASAICVNILLARVSQRGKTVQGEGTYGAFSRKSECAMKTSFKVLLLALLALPAVGQAQNYSAPYYFSMNADNTATITGYSCPGGAATIPSTISVYPVTRIGCGAFEGCLILSGVTFGTNVASFGEAAFDGCTNPTGVTIPNSVTNIEHYAFQ